MTIMNHDRWKKVKGRKYYKATKKRKKATKNPKIVIKQEKKISSTSPAFALKNGPRPLIPPKIKTSKSRNEQIKGCAKMQLKGLISSVSDM